MVLCMSAKAKPVFTAQHRAFVTDGIKRSTPVSVAAAHVTGTTATVSAKDIHVSGTTLYSLMMAHSTGVNRDSSLSHSSSPKSTEPGMSAA